MHVHFHFCVCVFDQGLYMDAVQLFPDHLQEFVDLMTEKELRLRLPLEELDILLEDWTDTHNSFKSSVWVCFTGNMPTHVITHLMATTGHTHSCSITVKLQWSYLWWARGHFLYMSENALFSQQTIMTVFYWLTLSIKICTILRLKTWFLNKLKLHDMFLLNEIAKSTQHLSQIKQIVNKYKWKTLKKRTLHFLSI